MKSQSKIIARIVNELRGNDSFAIVGHVRPDGDCIGSQLALTYALRDQGKQVVCWNEDSVPQKLRFLDPEGLVQKPKGGQEFDCVIATDCASFERLGSVGEAIARRKVLINVDHHQSNTLYGDINLISGREASTGEMIFHLLKAAGWPITPPIADCLFTAVSTDTGSFQYPTTQPATYNIAGELVRLGANLAVICDEVYQSYPLSRVRLLKHVYNSFRLTYDDQIAYFWLRKRDFTRTGADLSDSEGLIDHIRAIEPVVVACLFEEMEPNITRISLRSKSDRVNVNEIAGLFGGGGHSAAAGARIEGKPMGVQRRVIGAIRKALNSAH
jgi:bifunctional oligoribonuclease and PAP phosphatase NrnA